MSATDDRRIIPDRGEFIDVLHAMRKGHVLVHAGDFAGGWAVDGGRVYTSHAPLLSYELVEPFDNPEGFESAQYFRLSERGREFARRACEAWRSKPLLERMAVRFTG